MTVAATELRQLVRDAMQGEPNLSQAVTDAILANPDVVLRTLTPHVRDAIGELRCVKGHAVDLVALPWEDK